MPKYELLVGSQAFWDRARGDLATATRRALVQAMTFEGDAAGLGVAAAIRTSPAADRRVLVDDYTRHNINDTMLAFSRAPALRAEAAATWAMFDALAASGAGLRITNPVGRNPLRLALRNHKKLLVIDDTAWIGGINFSDHNFAWHDMMLRIEHPAIADWFAAEFERDWSGNVASRAEDLAGASLFSLDGSTNPAQFAPLLDLFAQARRSIEVISAYPTFPFVDCWSTAAQRGVAVKVYTPRPNNKPVVRDYLLGSAVRAGIDLQLTPEMTHAKAALIDGEALVLGSSNFDLISHRANAEYLAVIRDSELIAQFEAQMLAPIRAGAQPPSAADHSRWRALKARLGLRAADLLIGALKHGPRVMEWPLP